MEGKDNAHYRLEYEDFYVIILYFTKDQLHLQSYHRWYCQRLHFRYDDMVFIVTIPFKSDIVGQCVADLLDTTFESASPALSGPKFTSQEFSP